MGHKQNFTNFWRSNAPQFLTGLRSEDFSPSSFTSTFWNLEYYSTIPYPYLTWAFEKIFACESCSKCEKAKFKLVIDENWQRSARRVHAYYNDPSQCLRDVLTQPSAVDSAPYCTDVSGLSSRSYQSSMVTSCPWLLRGSLDPDSDHGIVWRVPCPVSRVPRKL